MKKPKQYLLKRYGQCSDLPQQLNCANAHRTFQLQPYWTSRESAAPPPAANTQPQSTAANILGLGQSRRRAPTTSSLAREVMLFLEDMEYGTSILSFWQVRSSSYILHHVILIQAPHRKTGSDILQYFALQWTSYLYLVPQYRVKGYSHLQKKQQLHDGTASHPNSWKLCK